MKRPSATVIAVVNGIALFLITEVIVWWPDPPKKKSDDPAPPEPPLTVQPAVVELPPPSPAPTPSAAPARPGLTSQPQADFAPDEIRGGCAATAPRDPCIVCCNRTGCATGKGPAPARDRRMQHDAAGRMPAEARGAPLEGSQDLMDRRQQSSPDVRLARGPNRP
jgi:hypothetical protein